MNWCGMLIFVASRTSKTKIAKMANKQKTIVALVAIIIAGGLIYFTVGRKAKVNQIKIDNLVRISYYLCGE